MLEDEETKYEKITNIDFSYSVIKQMNDKYREECPQLVFKQMDVRQL